MGAPTPSRPLLFVLWQSPPPPPPPHTPPFVVPPRTTPEQQEPKANKLAAPGARAQEVLHPQHPKQGLRCGSTTKPASTLTAAEG